jgi:DNA-directed DNA polymerase III PolC
MFSYAYDFTPVVEVGSIDEAYADLRGNTKKTPQDIAESIRKAVRETLRITLSEGVAANKLVSQVASKWKKPDALTQIAPGREGEFLAPLENKWLPGIGPQLAATLSRAGLPLIGQIARTPPEQLSLFAGKNARTLWEFANGIDERPVVAEAPAAKSYSEQQTFEADTADELFVLAVLRSMADRLFAKARAEGQAARTISVRVRYNDFEECLRSCSLDEPTDLETTTYGLIATLLKKAWERRVSLRLVSLKLSNLYKGAFFTELPLIPATQNSATLHRAAMAVDEIRSRHGSGAILRGHDLWLREHQSPPSDVKKPSQPVIRRATKAPAAILHFRSCYSFMESLLTPERIVQIAAEAGCKAVGICDPNLHAAVPLFQAAQAAGLQPVIGAELCVNNRLRRLYAKDRTGYQNLCRLLSEPKITRDFWMQHRDGLLASPCNAPFIRCESGDDLLHLRILESIRTLTLLDQAHPGKSSGGVFTAAANADVERIAGECGFAFEFGELSFPHFDPPEACTPREFLARRAVRGLVERYGARAEHHRAQLDTELQMIAEVGYEEYFLTVWDLLQHCRRDGIEWITRGSAADSLVCFCLGISNVCPVRFELYFQRFLNRDRMALKKLPDIDLDFPHDRKDAVVEKVFRLHKPGHVAVVGGFNTFHARSAVAEIGKVLGIPERVVRRLTEHFPWLAKAGDAENAAATAKAQGLCEEEPALTALKLAARLEGLPRHAKMHPCGVVLSRRQIHDFTPTFQSNKGWPTTHFDMNAVEDVGLVKLDILAQGGLAVLRDARAELASRGIEVSSSFAGPWDDDSVWEMIATGNARGVHHIESPAMTSLAKMCACRDIDSLVAIVSVIRPGAANTLRKSTFARRALGLEKPEYPHPSLEPVLRSTHGVIAYEEHILQIADAFAAMPPGRADILRRALVKMRDAEIEKMRLEFEEFARRNGRSEEDITAVWNLVHMFRGYAFCRAHSTAYALEAWQAACLKKHHPAEFLAAVLTHGKGFYSRLLYSLECRRLGIGFLQPDVNASHGRFFVERKNRIRVPIEAIANLPEALLERISSQLKRGSFQSLEDFFQRTAASEEALHLLLRVGALDSLIESRTGAVWDIRQLARDGSSMFSERNQPRPSPATPLLERLRDELELLGLTVSAHPLDLWPDIAWETYCPVAHLAEHIGRRVTLCGLVVADRTHHQSNGELMKFMTLCDRSGLIETELFARAFKRFGLETIRHPVLQVTGIVVPFDGATGHTLRVESVRQPRKKQHPA